ncbi:MAG: hypothetical protein GEV28_25005 [Actinophytocola sp.]|uniref:hypothetical protein n=1 Tax=Actinophytocola sp. TaxID=1872138 RepID=UPI001329253E|nr:hypothetical protein [Actinophytocola sp.]MPZ83474.1 hypothetical protein [Actinophytocola sp.]
MRTIVVGAVLLIVGVLATPFATAAADDGVDDGGTPADALILAARQEVTSFAVALSASPGTEGAEAELLAQADVTSAALRDVLAVSSSYPCPSDAGTCREKISAAVSATQAVDSDVQALIEPDADPALVDRYDTHVEAFNSAWDEFRIAYREATRDESGLSSEAIWLMTAAAIVLCIALTVALRFWVRRTGTDDRLTAARKAVYSASQLLTFALIGVSVVMLLVDGFDATLEGRSGGKAALLVLLVPVAAIYLIVVTVKYLVLRAKVRRTAAAVAH